jgi:hypothetical protein
MWLRWSIIISRMTVFIHRWRKSRKILIYPKKISLAPETLESLDRFHQVSLTQMKMMKLTRKDIKSATRKVVLAWSINTSIQTKQKQKKNMLPLSIRKPRFYSIKPSTRWKVK